jgi:hypothetical protein
LSSCVNTNTENEAKRKGEADGEVDEGSVVALHTAEAVEQRQ